MGSGKGGGPLNEDQIMAQNIFDKTILILDNQNNHPSKWLELITPLIRKDAYEKSGLIEMGTDAYGRNADCHYFQQNSVFVLLTMGRGSQGTDRIDMIDQSQKKLLSIYWNVGTHLDHVDSEIRDNASEHPTYRKIAEKFGLAN